MNCDRKIKCSVESLRAAILRFLETLSDSKYIAEACNSTLQRGLMISQVFFADFYIC
jgi:hypothetical protein